jgi:transcriptional regulator with XRE-family HTH domain
MTKKEKVYVRRKDILEYNNEDWDMVTKNFNEEYTLEGKLDIPFSKLMEKIFIEKDVTSGKDFAEITGLDRTYYSRFRSEGYKPAMKTLITVCMSLNIDVLKVLKLLDSIGAGFKKDNKTHYAYYYLVLKYQGEDIENCNIILERLGINEVDFLGVKE